MAIPTTSIPVPSILALPLPPDVLSALCERADRMGDAEETPPGAEEAAQYLLLLEACVSVLRAAPTSPEQCTEEQINRCYVDALVRLVSSVADVLPGGIDEMCYYLPSGQQASDA